MSNSPSGSGKPIHDDSIELIFDAECPVCTLYAESVVAADGTGQTVSINARSGHARVEQAISHGLNLDEGMAAYHRGRFYHGADALNFLATHRGGEGRFAAFNRFFFSRKRLSKAVYPLLRFGRNMLLLVRGKKGIHASGVRAK